ncbi:MAG: glycosyltransferase [Xenococcus sp. MO_188.B8]|nr:glycosyltransferase [Xenococcus sp. MO_188.B8]
MKLVVYSHDTYGLGNLRRMLAICQYLLKVIPELSILLVSGSPVVHSFRMPQGLDYLKLPCLGRCESGKLSSKYLKIETDKAIKMRSSLIKTAVINFQPDLLLVDKKPYALQGELTDTLEYLKVFSPLTKVVLLLRDILDSPEKTIAEWQQKRYYEGIKSYYDKALVVGMQSIFDLTREYQFPDYVSEKVKFCGYLRRESGAKTPDIVRQELQIETDEKLVLVTPGGGADGYNLVKNYLLGLAQLDSATKIKSLIISGPEMPLSQQQEFIQIACQNNSIQFMEFSDDLNSYITAADVVVSMAGYNTVCEILSLNKKAVVVPRTQPVQEQWIRASTMARLGLLKAIHPDELNPEIMIQAVWEQLNNNNHLIYPIERIVDLDGLSRIAKYISGLLKSEESNKFQSNLENTPPNLEAVA